MSGLKTTRLPFLVDDTGAPMGVKMSNGTEVMLPRFSPDMTAIMKPDGSLISMNAVGQVQADWNATDGMASILNKPTVQAAPAPAAAVRALNTIFQVHQIRNALVAYSVMITVTASISGGQNGDVLLEVASDAGFTANVQTLAIVGNGQTYSLAVALAGVQPITQVLFACIPAGYFARLRTVNNLGTPAFAFRAGQEVLL